MKVLRTVMSGEFYSPVAQNVAVDVQECDSAPAGCARVAVPDALCRTPAAGCCVFRSDRNHHATTQWPARLCLRLTACSYTAVRVTGSGAERASVDSQARSQTEH